MYFGISKHHGGYIYGSIFNVFLFSKFQFLPFLGIFAVLGHVAVFGHLDILRVLVSYKVTIRIIWVVGRVPEGF